MNKIVLVCCWLCIVVDLRLCYKILLTLKLFKESLEISFSEGECEKIPTNFRFINKNKKILMNFNFSSGDAIELRIFINQRVALTLSKRR